MTAFQRRPRFMTLLALGVTGLAVVSCRERATTGLLTQDAYVWQRAWTPAVAEAVSNAPTDLTRLVVLAAQVGWSGARPVPVRIAVNHDALKACGRPIGLALRVTACAEPLAADGPAVTALCTLAQSVVTEARSHAIESAEVQVDYDCPERRLAEYAAWVARLREAVRPTPVRVTVLPSWLRHRECRDLLRRVDGCVLQVHWLHDTADGVCLFDASSAREAVRAIARLDAPFDVALPTYAYLAAHDESGHLLGVSAEGPLPNWPRSARLDRVRAEPAYVAALIREWSAQRPVRMGGVIWYRLPVAGDTLNWASATWARVRRGEVPQAAPRVLLEWRDERLADVVATNAGDDEASMAGRRFKVVPVTGRVETCDGVGGFVVRLVAGNVIEIEASGGTRVDPLRAGERRIVGWVRVETP